MRCAFIYLACGLLIGCTLNTDEALMISTTRLQLKVVRYREYQPFSNGYSYTVQCRTEATANVQADPGRQGHGWITLAAGLDSSSRSASAIVSTIRSGFQVFNEDVLVWSRDGAPSISGDGCITFRTWSPASVHLRDISPAPVWPRDKEPAPLESKPFFCADPATDCRAYEFGGSRRLYYDHLQVTSDGHVSFDVKSTAFISGELHVESSDWGTSWRYTPVLPRTISIAVELGRAVPAAFRALPAARPSPQAPGKTAPTGARIRGDRANRRPPRPPRGGRPSSGRTRSKPSTCTLAPGKSSRPPM